MSDNPAELVDVQRLQDAATKALMTLMYCKPEDERAWAVAFVDRQAEYTTALHHYREGSGV